MNVTTVYEDDVFKVTGGITIKILFASYFCLQGIGRMFYLVSPSETSFPDKESIPISFISAASPYFFGLISLEWSLKWAMGEAPRINDGLLSIVHGLLMTLME